MSYFKYVKNTCSMGFEAPQKTTPLSSCESEYVAATNAANSVVFLNELIEDITKLPAQQPTTIYCDNSAACQLTEDALSGKRVKHALRKLTYLRELNEDGQIKMTFISGENNPADIFTKQLPASRFIDLRSMMLRDDDQDSGEATTSDEEVEIESSALTQTCDIEGPKVLILFSGPYDCADTCSSLAWVSTLC